MDSSSWPGTGHPKEEGEAAEMQGAFLTGVNSLAEAEGFPYEAVATAGGVTNAEATGGSATTAVATAETAGFAQVSIVKTSADDPEQHRKHASLVAESTMRAEQQESARLHMLELTRALEESNRHRNELMLTLRKERTAYDALKAKNDELDSKLDEALQKEEDQKVAALEEKMKGKQGCFLGALFMSRQVAHRGQLLDEGEEEPVFLCERERQVAEAAMVAKAAMRWKRKAKTKGSTELVGGGETKGGEDGGDASTPSTPAAPVAPKRPPAPTQGDILTITWALKLWRHHVETMLGNRLEEKRKQEERDKEEAARAKARADMDRAVEAERKISEALNKQLEAAKEKMILAERKQQRLEEERNALEKRVAELNQQHIAEKQALQRSIDEANKQIAERDGSLEEAKERMRDLQEQVVRAEQHLQNEREAMKANLRDLSAQLQQAEIMAKHMRETALRAKREAASSVSPEKFAQLIAELEEMKDKLAWMGKDCDKEHNLNFSLMQKLEQNSRRLELERQFLPLLHKVRGPVGPQNPVLSPHPSKGGKRGMAGQQTAGTPQSSPLKMGSPEKLSSLSRGMAQSASDGSLQHGVGGQRTRGMPLGGDAAGGGRRQLDAASSVPSLH